MKLGTANRVKKSYSLSVESEQYVRRYRKARKIASDSEALDRLLQEAAAAEKLKKVEDAYKAYYDNAPDEELSEGTAWAEAGAAALEAVDWNA